MRRGLSIFCTIVMIVSLFSVLSLPTAALTTKTWSFSQLAGYYKTQGRVEVVDTALNMDTSGSGFEFYFYGSGDVSMGADIKCGYTTDMFLTVIVDGVKSRVKVDTGTTKTAVYKSVALATGLMEGYHHVEVYKQTEMKSAFVTVWGVTFAGDPVAAPPADKITIEVVGDSISGGASNLATNSTANASYPVYQDGTQTYAYLTGEALGANVRVTQTSGYGCCGGWNGEGTSVNLQTMFPYTSYWRDSSANGYYDFDPAADIVVINLGTNDGSAASSGRISLTNAQFKAGAKNLMTMAREKNPGAKVVWCTGMMGVYYKTELTAAVSELGGASAGYYFLQLPEGRSGGDGGHPNVAEHVAASKVLTSFLLENCLPADHLIEFKTAAQLEAALTAAKTVASPSAALQAAITTAQMELDCGTTDEYRLGVRAKALNDAVNGYVTALDLMPVKGVTQTPQSGNDDYIWPYYDNPDCVALYKGGDGEYWPSTHTDYMQVINVTATPYVTVDVQSTAQWNMYLAYLDKTGARQTVSLADVAQIGSVNFPVQATRKVFTVDLGAYVTAQGHADANGNITVVGCDLFAIGVTDTCVLLYTCVITDRAAEELPTAISGDYTVKNGVLCGVTEGTAAALLDKMDHASYLRVVDAAGATVTGAVATGMRLQLVVDATVIDEAYLAVTGDFNGDGVMNTQDARDALLRIVLDGTTTAWELQAVDLSGDSVLSTADVRTILVMLAERAG